MFLFFILVPRTELLGEPDRYVKKGSTVILRCVVRGALEPPSYITWYHGVQQLYTDNFIGRIIEINRESTIDGSDTDSHSTVGNLLFLVFLYIFSTNTLFLQIAYFLSIFFLNLLFIFVGFFSQIKCQ